MKPGIFFFFALTLLLSGCDVRYTHKFQSYILYYNDYQDFILEICDSGGITIAGFGGKEVANWESKRRKKVIYDSLCVLHNDMRYNTKRDFIASPGWGDCFKSDIVSIDVVSNTDFDEQHPAYSSLNDIIRLLSVSLY
jgi:hypothetical protein